MEQLIMKILAILAILAQTSFAQKRIAILGTEDDGEPSLKITELNYLTSRLREIASDVLKSRYGIMDQQSIFDKLGSKEKAAKVCKEASCLADLGRKLNADYVAQGRVGRFGKRYTIEVKLYNSASGLQMSIFTGDSKDVFGLLEILNEKTPDMFRKIMPKEQQTAPSGGLSGNVLTDSRDGKKYRVVKIGNQIWMAENLNYNASGSKCYDNLESNCEKYGRLYNWDMAMIACPSGWHLSSDNEWTVLMNFVNYTANPAVKLMATSGWRHMHSGGCTDDYGFSALPGGGGYENNKFSGIDTWGNWWSAKEAHPGSAYKFSGDIGIGKSSDLKIYLFSVRCLKN
jgi:uncharacterized protein (TIGR02145 family)